MKRYELTEAEPELPLHKEITKLSWSYEEKEIPIDGISRHYADLNLHVETKNYAEGEHVYVTIEKEDGTNIEYGKKTCLSGALCKKMVTR